MTELEKFLKKEVSEKNGYQIVDYINQYSLTTDWIDTDRPWQLTIRKCGSWSVQLEIEFSDVRNGSEEHIEFGYVIILNHKKSSAKNAIVFSGRGIIDEKSNPISISNHKLSTFHRLHGVSFEDMYMKFAVTVFMFYGEDGIRNFMFEDQYDLPLIEKVVDGYKLYFWMRDIEQRAPLFAKALDANELGEETQNNLEKFIQVLLGVHIQLKKKEIKPLLKLATKYKVFAVKRYCENQLIWRDELGFSIQQKYKIARKYNLNILMKMDFEVSKSGVQVELADKTIWKKFYPNTEMITTKVAGRIIFPHLEYKIKGLQADCRYKIYLFVERADNEKYTFDSGHWQSIGKGKKPSPIQFKEHPSGARLGSHWMKGKVSFSHLRLTTDPNNVDKRMILQGKYMPTQLKNLPEICQGHSSRHGLPIHEIKFH